MANYALVLLLLAAPERSDTPKDAVERLVAAVRKVDFVGAYEQLGAGGRKLLDKELERSARSVGLDPANATHKQILEAYQKRFATETGRQLANGFSAAVVDTNETGDTAVATVRMTLEGRTDRVKLLFVRKNGRWRIDGVDTSEARMAANETAAIATLRNITSAQAQFQACAKADANANGTGEYGTFGELSGAVAVRGGDKLNPPVLSRVFGQAKKGVVTRSGYHFRVFLCDTNGRGIGEERGTQDVDAGKAETVWCCYAWPVAYGKTGKRTFFVNQFGDILQLDHKGYAGQAGPAADAAFKKEDARGRITGPAAINALGSDGKRWKWTR